MKHSDSLKQFAPALVRAQRNMGAAIKDAKNPFFKSKFADLNSIIEAAVPSLNAEGFTVMQNPSITDGGVAVLETTLLHESGEFVSNQTAIVVAKQNDPQAYGSALSYARRYGLQATVCLRAEDDDAEGQMTRAAIPAKVVAAATKPELTVAASVVVEKESLPSVEKKGKVTFNKKSAGSEI
jgi:hypothetical protein